MVLPSCLGSGSLTQRISEPLNLVQRFSAFCRDRRSVGAAQPLPKRLRMFRRRPSRSRETHVRVGSLLLEFYV